MAVVSIANDGDFSFHVRHKKGIVLVYFGAAWCGPCKLIKAEINAIARDLPTLHVACVDVDAHEAIAAEYDIMAVPTLLFFTDGKPLKRMIGYASQEEIKKYICDIETSLGATS